MRTRYTRGRGTLQTITSCTVSCLPPATSSPFLMLSADVANSKGFCVYLAHLAVSVQLLQEHTLVL